MIKFYDASLRIWTVNDDGKTATWRGFYGAVETVAIKDLKIIDIWEG
jgi:hypothetical protein